jgi:glutathione S-transferase
MPETPVTLQKFLPVWGLLDLSPFCFKAELYLKLARIPYVTALGDSRKAPKNKLPVLIDGGHVIADSSAIIEHLERTRGKPLDAHLSASQRAIATAVKAMLEEQLYFVIVVQRWREDHNWTVYRPVFLELVQRLGVPGFLGSLVVGQIRKQMIASARAQGHARHTPEELTAIGLNLLDATSELCQGPFYLGERPSTLDATVYAFVESIASAPFAGPLKDRARSDGKLARYRAHMKQHCAL